MSKFQENSSILKVEFFLSKDLISYHKMGLDDSQSHTTVNAQFTIDTFKIEVRVDFGKETVFFQGTTHTAYDQSLFQNLASEIHISQLHLYNHFRHQIGIQYS